MAAIITKRSTQVSLNVNPTVASGTVDTDYPAINLIDDIPGLPCVLTTTTGKFEWAFGAGTTIKWVGICHHNLDAGLDVRVEVGSGSGGGFSLSAAWALVIPPYLGTGTRRWPMNGYVDISTATPLSGSYGGGSWNTCRVSVYGTNSQAIQIGQIVIYSNNVTIDPNFKYSYLAPNKRDRNRLILESTTAYGVDTIYSKGTVIWSAEGEITCTKAQHDTLFSQWTDVGGRDIPFMFVPDIAVNEWYYVRYADGLWSAADFQNNKRVVQLRMREVSRGLRLGT